MTVWSFPHFLFLLKEVLRGITLTAVHDSSLLLLPTSDNFTIFARIKSSLKC